MSDHSDISKLNTCGCCETEISRPVHHNLPGQPALKYRLGTHATFLAAMKAHLPGQYIEILLKELDEHGKQKTGRIYPLQDLTTRSPDDPAIALLDAWAMVADVLIFYQERIANESYLRTAIERRSVLELARAIGYELKPGVSASTYLAFTSDDVPGSPSMATVARGTRVQSVPSQGQLPQTFETSEQITARAQWNVMRPRMTRPQELAIRQGKLYLLGISTSFPPGHDVVTIPSAEFDDIYPLDESLILDPTMPEVQAVEVRQVSLEGTNTDLKTGDLLLLVGKRASDTKTIALLVKKVEVDKKTKRTRVKITDAPPPPTFRLTMMKKAVPKLDHIGFAQTSVNDLIKRQTWRERDLNAFLSIQNWNEQNLTEHVNAKSRETVIRPQPTVDSIQSGIFRFSKQVGFFGHNAPRWDTLPTNQRFGEMVKPSKDEQREWKDGAFNLPWDSNGWEIWKQYPENNFYSNTPANHDVYLEQSFSDIVKNSWVVFENAAGERYTPYRITDVSDISVTGFALSAKVTGLTLKDEDNDPLSKPIRFKVRNTTANIQSEQLTMLDLPIEEPLEEIVQNELGEIFKKGVAEMMLDRLVLNLQVGQSLVLSGEQEDAARVIRHEVIFLKDIIHTGGYTTLHFQDRLKYRYVRKTVTLNANVAHATHGETVHEVLGSGDGSQTHQRFVLKKPPLTYVSAATPGGTKNSLQVHINDIMWEEVPSLYDLDAQSQKYIVRIDDDAKATIIFGDGKMGARLPSGTENVTATYRSGIGPDGEVDAGSLTMLQTRPLGIKEVINPLPASGSEAPQDLDKARANAPQTVLTFDRIVSLRDFEDFSRSFAGIGKAKAVAVWNEERFKVHVTVASATGQVISTDSDLYKNLIDAVGNAGDPGQKFQVDSYKPAFFNVKARLLVDSRHTPAFVIAAVETALKDAFSFEKRTFGQPVTTADIVSVIQNVPGVAATDLDQFYRYYDSMPIPEPHEQIIPDTGILDSDLPFWEKENKKIRKAELLLINPVGITLEGMIS